MPISKPDFNLIFASQAPSQDLPAAFNNYARGWDEARKNNGKPTIKQFNYLIQQLDLKALWMIQNGAALPFDENVDYTEGAFTVKDGSLQQFVGGVWKKPTQTADQIFDESGLSQQDVNNRLLKSYTIDLSYLRPPKDFDLYPLIQEALNKTSIAPISLILPCGEFTMSNPVATPVGSKGVIFNLNGSTLKAQAGYSSPSVYLLNLTSTTMHPVIICNGVLDGSIRAQNLFEATDPIDLRMGTSGISCQAIDVIFENLTIQHMYGQATKTFCRNFKVTNVFVNDCGGHWYLNNTYDSFGDAFYIGTGFNTSGIINVTFNNVIAKAKYSRQYPENHQVGSVLSQDMYSRIGVTLEKFGGTNSNIVNMSFNNCDFQYFERGIHQEASGITSNIEMQNTRFDSAVMFGAYLTDVLNARASKCKFGLYDANYSGSKGITRSYSGSARVTLDAECIVEQYGTDNKNALGVGGSLIARNTKFKNIQNMWSDGLTVFLTDCDIEVSKHSTFGYAAWNSYFTIKNTKIRYVGADATLKTYTQHLNFNLDNVEFDNIYLAVDSLNTNKFKSSRLIVNNDSTLNLKGTLWDLRNRDGLILNYPALLWGVSKENLELARYTYQKYPKPSGGSISLINDAVRNLYNRVSFFMIVVKGHDDGLNRLQNISSTTYGNGYYVAVAKKDSTQPSGLKLIKPFTAVGSTSGAGYGLTIDSEFNVSGIGQYVTYIHAAFVPYSTIDTLPDMPDALIS